MFWPWRISTRFDSTWYFLFQKWSRSVLPTPNGQALDLFLAMAPSRCHSTDVCFGAVAPWINVWQQMFFQVTPTGWKWIQYKETTHWCSIHLSITQPTLCSGFVCPHSEPWIPVDFSASRSTRASLPWNGCGWGTRCYTMSSVNLLAARLCKCYGNNNSREWGVVSAKVKKSRTCTLLVACIGQDA